MCGLEVRHTDAAGTSFLGELLEDIPGGDKVASIERRQGPVDEKQVDIVGTECGQRLVERASRIVGPMKAVVQFARDEDIGAIQPGVSDALADAFLVPI